MFKNLSDFAASGQPGLVGIDPLSSEVAKSPELADRLRRAHAWYVDARDPDHSAFGFSTFIGYEALTAATYLQNRDDLTSSHTVRVLKPFCEELVSVTPEFRFYHKKLLDWLAGFRKKARSLVRIMI